MSSSTDKYPRGSEWSKWDLHVHSPASIFWDGGKNLRKMSVAEKETEIKCFLKTVNESDIQVFTIMDYWTFDWCIELKKYIATHPGELKKTVFSGMELRVECSVDYRLNIHFILSDKLTEQQLLDFKSAIKIRIGATVKNLSDEALIELAKTFDESKAKKYGYQDPETLGPDLLLELGSKTAEVTRDSLLDAFKKIPEGTGFILLPYDTSDGLLDLKWWKHPQDDNFFMQTASIFESRDQRNIDLFNGKKTDENKDFFNNFLKTLGNITKPCVSGSDAHKFIHYGKYPNNKITWIKADPTFEGLKQILWEPAERVKVQERNPADSKPDRIIIDYITYKNSNGGEEKVYFNRDLNSIIGSRGKGKSTLLKNIANKIDSNQFSEKDKKTPYPLVDFKVVWADKKEDGGNDEFSPKSIFYIPQNYLSSLAYDDGEKTRERDQFLTNLLKKNMKFSNAVQKYENFVSTNKIKIEQLIQTLLTSYADLLEGRASLKKQGAKTEIEKEIENKTLEIKKYKDDSGTVISEDDLTKYSMSVKAVSEGTKEVGVLNQDKIILNGLKESGASIHITNQEFTLLSLERQKLIKAELSKQGKENLSNLIQNEIENIDKQIAILTKSIEKNSQVSNALEQRIKNSKALEDLTKELNGLQKILEKIDELSKRIEQSKNDCLGTIKGLVEANDEFNVQQNIIYKTITFDENFSFLKIDIVAAYNIQQLKDFVERNINTRDTDLNLKTDEDIKKLFSESPELLSKEIVEKLIIGLISNKIKIKVEAGEVADVLSQLLRNKFEIDYLNSVKTKDGGVLFKDMTGGQKAIAFLELVFSFDDEKYPILIDQPEDDLDVSGIATDLVNFIKSEKHVRQIIVVSHNASLVICADTEEVLVSDNKRVSAGEYDFSYTTGSIENARIREEIIKVLEGGREALKARARKLNFKHEI